jgi:hypothetical protein
MYSENGTGTSLWILAALFSAVPTICLCYSVLDWDRLMQKMYDQFAGKAPPSKSWLFGIEQDPAAWFLVDSNKLCVRAMIGISLFCAIPLWWIINTCTELPLQKTVTGWLLYIRDITY